MEFLWWLSQAIFAYFLDVVVFIGIVIFTQNYLWLLSNMKIFNLWPFSNLSFQTMICIRVLIQLLFSSKNVHFIWNIINSKTAKFYNSIGHYKTVSIRQEDSPSASDILLICFRQSLNKVDVVFSIFARFQSWLSISYWQSSHYTKRKEFGQQWRSETAALTVSRAMFGSSNIWRAA